MVRSDLAGGQIYAETLSRGALPEKLQRGVPRRSTVTSGPVGSRMQDVPASRSKPGLAPSEARGRAGLPAAVQAPGIAIGPASIERQRGAVGRKERRLHPDGTLIDS